MIYRKKLRIVGWYYLEFFYEYKIYFEGMLNKTVYEWVGVNSHSMNWPVGTGPGLYRQIVVDKVVLLFV